MLPNLYAFCVAFSLAFFQPVPAASANNSTDPDMPGDWIGTLNTPQGTMRLWLTVTADKNHTLTAQLESIDQAPGQKIPVNDILVKDNRLTFKISAIGASYTGTWQTANSQWVGTFSQGMEFPLAFKRGRPTPKATIEGLDGIWRATINRNGKNLRFALKVQTGANGTQALLDALDAPAYNIPVSGLAREGNNIQFKVAAASVTFNGDIDEKASMLTGEWQRTDEPALTLTFKRESQSILPTKRKRPQEPKSPLPYKTEGVHIKNDDAADVVLAGTLTLPMGTGPFPAAILISGSGASDRNESFMGHKPFLVLSDHLTRNGIAVLRYDDRGFAGSTGNYSLATSADFATDANAIFKYLAGRRDIDKGAIGFIGHSEGGLIAPIALHHNKDAAFMVMLAGPGTDTIQLSLSQARLTALARGTDEAELNKMLKASRDIMETVAATQDSTLLIEKLDEILTSEILVSLGATAEQRDMIKQQFTSPWYRFFVTYDPADYLPQLKLPVLAIGGSLDWQVPSDENLAGIKKLLTNNNDTTVRQLEGLNHMFQNAKTGAMGEYRDIEETFAPHALDMISSWINARFK